MLAGFPTLSTETVKDGSFMEGLESYLSDNMLERDRLVAEADQLMAYLSLPGSSTDELAQEALFEQVAREVSDKVTAHINKNVAPLMPQRESWKSRYFHGAMQSMIGAIVLPLIVGVVLFAWKHSMNEVWKALAEFFGSLAQ